MSDMLDALLRARAEQLGAAKEHSDVVALLARKHLDMKPDGSVRVLDASGAVRIGSGPAYADMTMDELMDELAATKPALFGPVITPEPAEPEPVAEERPKVRDTSAMSIRERIDFRKGVVAPDAVLEGKGNPYAANTRNTMVCMWLEAKHPERAAQLKDEAESKASSIPFASDLHRQ